MHDLGISGVHELGSFENGHLRIRGKEFSQTNYSLISIRLIRVTYAAL